MSGKTRRVLLAGNPNVGKSTVFNALTGLRQHTGNWPGKTVETAVGRYAFRGVDYELVDLPGAYSLNPRSQEERVALEALERWDYDCVAVVCDATMLRRNLILVYQILALEVPVVVCVNLMDEARRKRVTVDLPELQRLLGARVVGTSAGRKEGLEALRLAIARTAEEQAWSIGQNLPGDSRERAALAERTAGRVTQGIPTGKREQMLDKLVTGKWTGIPILLLLLFFLLWITIAGANIPSDLLWRGVERLYGRLTQAAGGWPAWLRGALLDGILLTMGRVVAVMLPPMAIFFPLFTLLEDLGYLPRMAYNMDHALDRCGGCGKMALTMCMGLGCNAAGVIGCRIIDAPRERLMGILTNSLIPCNGRFGALILLMTAFLIPSGWGSAGAALGLTAFLAFSVLAVMGVCKLLSVTVLRGVPTAFALELPPYRRPRVGQVLIRSVLDRTLRVLWRAVIAAAPAGLILWVLSQVSLGDRSLIASMAWALDPMGRAMGMSGVLLTGFILGWPANEIVLPVAVLAATGTLQMEAGAASLGALRLGWETALCTAVFFLFHWPCATTCMTIRKETGSLSWTLLAAALPTVLGMLLCLLIHGVFLLL